MEGIQGIYELQKAEGTKRKEEIISQYSEDIVFKKLLFYALNPLITYNLSEKTIREVNSEFGETVYNDIFECCEDLLGQRGISDLKIRQVQSFLFKYTPEKHRELYIKLLSKTLRLGVTAKTVNKIIPGLIPAWEVQQAYPIEKYPIPEGTEFWLTQKLNGVRATYYKGKLISRSGAPYKGLEHITNQLASLPVDYVFEGELTLKDKGSLSDNEAFRVATGIINSDDEDKTCIMFTIFDVVLLNDFENDNSKISYSERRSFLTGIDNLINSDCIAILPVLYHGTNQNEIYKYLDLMVREDKEGLMLNTNVPYKRKRHRGILKIKRFYTMDLPIIRCEEGSGRLEGTLGALVLDYKGNEVKVGSGFSDQQRFEYWGKKDELSGILCEVKYKEISNDKNTGFESLQFPVFVRLRDDKLEVSYG